MKPRSATLIPAALLALSLCVADSGFLSSLLRTAIEPARCRVAAVLGGICYAATSTLAGEQTGHTPGGALVAVPLGPRAVGLDPEGYVAAYDSLEKFDGVPLLTGFKLGSTEPGEFASSPEAFLGITVVKAFDTTPGLSGMLRRVDLEDIANPEVVLESGAVVRLGTGNYALKLKRLREVLSQAAYLGMKPETIDLRFRDQVVVRPGTIDRSKDREV